MVFVNDKKFACESCIKGHRSSGCQHTERPLFEVKKKGRPVSQCEKCRELRKTKQMHGKCTCASNTSSGSSVQATSAETTHESAPKVKARRFKPIAPALPNGIKDVISPDSDARASVSLNLCRCGGKDASICTCGHERAAPSAMTNAVDGLATLAQAAMFCCGGDLPSAIDKHAEPPAAPAATSDSASRKHTRSCCSSTANSRPPSPKPKRSKCCSHTSTHHHTAGPLVPTLPMSGHHHTPSQHAPPAFPPVASLSSVTSFDDTGCCCGTQCSCPGCLVHRGAEHAVKDYADCTDGECRTCVDHEGGYALPETLFAYSQGGSATASTSTLSQLPALAVGSSSASASTSTRAATAQPGRDRKQSISYIDAFFATAASLPAPPPGRTGALDPTNVLVYPRGVLAGGPEARSLFGLVEVPKLQCNCPGGCGCPEGQCGCGDGCTGCAPAHEEDGEAHPTAPTATTSATVAAPVRSCCGG